MINRLIYQLFDNSYFNFIQKCKALVIQTFGHETLFNLNETENPVYDHEFKTHIYPLGQINLNRLSWRKLLNPFKWLEAIFAFPLELLLWALISVPLSTKKSVENIAPNSIKNFLILGAEFTFRMIAHYLILPFAFVVVQIVLGLIRRILAPIRTIIRPALELYFSNLPVFLSVIGLSLAIMIIILASILTGFLPIPFLIGAAIGVKIASAIITFLASFVVVLKTAVLALEIKDLFERKMPNEGLKNQVVAIEGQTTAKVTELLHGLNRETTEIEEQDYQTSFYQFCLLTGIESIFYKPVLGSPHNSDSLFDKNNEQKNANNQALANSGYLSEGRVREVNALDNASNGSVISRSSGANSEAENISQPVSPLR